MKKDVPLTPSQRILVEDHLSVVGWVIFHYIKVNETIYGFSYDDLYQEGCIWLCRAAVSYDASVAKFKTYAKTVIRNGLISYCRTMCKKQKRMLFLTCEQGWLLLDGQKLATQENDFDATFSYLEVISLLEPLKRVYKGVARLGIEALQLKVQGLSVSEIACHYGVKPSHVGAWISRAAQKLRDNPSFLTALDREFWKRSQ
ncbi:sigma-70 family RNA polymerase sigma factor [Caproiciproducens sp. R1]|uniref:sigma-70 family RNA polymerase sigma factor n=1 Tax=Acutalibacteraceae TaxID=3082771 RepID=UPI002E15CE26